MTKKPLIIIPITLVVLVVAYLAYDLIKPGLSPCESIFQQTTLSLKSNIESIKSRGEVFIGQQKIQELTERAQMLGLNLKTCCILSNQRILSADEFLECKGKSEQYQGQIEKIVNYIDEAKEAKQQDRTDVVEEAISKINQLLASTQKSSQELQEYIIQQATAHTSTPISSPSPIKQETQATTKTEVPHEPEQVAKKKPEKGMGIVKTSRGSFQFDKITGGSMGLGKLTVFEFGATVEIPLDKIARIKLFLQDNNSVKIEYRDGQSEVSEFSCYWNTRVTFHSGVKKIYYADCAALKVVEEIEFYHPD